MKKILVIQQKMIGDVLVSTILCETLCKAFPSAQVDYLIYESTYPVIEANDKDYNIVLFKKEYRNSKKALIDFALSLKKENYDVVIDAYSKLESWIIVGLSNAKTKISFKKNISNFLYTHLIERHQNPTSNLGLVIEHRLKLLEPLNIPENLYVTTPKIKVTDNENTNATAFLKQNKVDLQKPIIMLNIIGSNETKTYPLEFMAEVMDLVAQNDVQILLNYIPNQIETAKEIFNYCQKETQEKVFFNVLGNSLRELIALINQCNMVIGNDGGTMNMAKALNKPTFIIFSPWIEKIAWSTFENGKQHISVHLNDYKPELFKNKSLKEIKKENQALYNLFLPRFFGDLLTRFIKINLINEQQ